MAFWDSKECVDDWKPKMIQLQKKSELIATTVLQKVSDAERQGKTLQELFGPQGDALSLMDAEQRKTYFRADAFITAIKETHSEHFADIVAEASKSEPVTMDDGMCDPNLETSDVAARLLDP